MSYNLKGSCKGSGRRDKSARKSGISEACIGGEKVQMAKVQNELHFFERQKKKKNKKEMFNHAQSKRKNKEIVCLLYGEHGELARGDTENEEVLNFYFASVFLQKENNGQPGASRTKEEVGGL